MAWGNPATRDVHKYKPQVAREQARQAAQAALESGKQKELPGVVDHNTDGDTAEH